VRLKLRFQVAQLELRFGRIAELQPADSMQQIMRVWKIYGRHPLKGSFPGAAVNFAQLRT
jgi:hypothetical protein